MDIHVYKVNRFASGASHVTIFDADVELGGVGVKVEVLATEPADAPQEAIEAARRAIQRGAERILEPKEQGATIRVKRLVIHPIDFKPNAFERYTAEALDRLMI